MTALAPRYPLYDGLTSPPGLPEFYGMHYNGTCHAYFCSANAAYAWWRGLGTRSQGYFHVEDAEGNRVTMEMNRHGHAYSILETLDRHEREGGDNANV